jgi:uncharacterized protein YqgV (UPF0045/DUF77 family)
MIVSVDISYYPLAEDFEKPVNAFIRQLADYPDISVETGKMSTMITGEFTEIMHLLTKTMGDLMDKYPSVFSLKISNSCICK